MDYTVQKGDTLSALAKKFNLPLEALVGINNIQDPNSIQAGATLNAPQFGPMEVPPNVFNPEVGMTPISEFLKEPMDPALVGVPPVGGPPFAWGGGGHGTISGEPAVTPMDAPGLPERNPQRVPPPAPEPSLLSQFANADFWNTARDELNKILPPEQVDEAIMMALSLTPLGRTMKMVGAPPRAPGPFANVAPNPAPAPAAPTPPPGPTPFNYRQAHRVARNRRVNRDDQYLQGEALERRRRRYENNTGERLLGQVRQKGELDQGTGPLVGTKPRMNFDY